MATDPTAGFDRVRPRTTGAGARTTAGTTTVNDREGKRALFSEVSVPPSMGSVALRCEKCGTRSVVTWARAVKLALPSVPAVVPGSGVRNFMRCPSCSQRSWLSVSVRA